MSTWEERMAQRAAARRPAASEYRDPHEHHHAHVHANWIWCVDCDEHLGTFTIALPPEDEPAPTPRCSVCGEVGVWLRGDFFG